MGVRCQSTTAGNARCGHGYGYRSAVSSAITLRTRSPLPWFDDQTSEGVGGSKRISGRLAKLCHRTRVWRGQVMGHDTCDCLMTLTTTNPFFSTPPPLLLIII
jgi:hypothetical protein